jgi:hypothetical protein
VIAGRWGVGRYMDAPSLLSNGMGAKIEILLLTVNSIGTPVRACTLVRVCTFEQTGPALDFPLLTETQVILSIASLNSRINEGKRLSRELPDRLPLKWGHMRGHLSRDGFP